MTLALERPLARAETRVVSVPLEPVIRTANYRIDRIEMVLLRVRDDDGRSGVATLWCFGRPQARVLIEAVRYLLPHAAGAGPRLAAVVAELRREINFLGFKGVSVFALAAIDMALHDLILRSRGEGIAVLVPRRRDSVPVYWSGLFLNQSREELVAEVETKLELGFRAFKLRVGHASADEDVRRAAAVAGRLPDGATLMLDAVQSWTVDAALDAAARLQEFGPVWLEDPLVHSDYAGLRRLVERSPIPIATGENEYLREGFAQLFDAGTPYLLADLQRVGGVTEWLAVAERAREHGAVLTPHVYPHAVLGLCAGLDQAETWIEYIPWWDALMPEPLELRDGAIVVRDELGLGPQPTAEATDAHALGPWEPVPLASARRAQEERWS